MMKIYIEDRRKTTRLAEKEYIAKVVNSVCKILSNVNKRIHSANSEVLVTEITNCKSMLENILDNLTYEN